ncbi:sterol desaturase family protein [Gynurincola endophyticus]|jgi:sterol desaturase/sphingolipid hydroxylase (fatty acid hydroxylase superfamily)|uniref:sterol desaturase family protein n=1 Tax=Gynurincola endophyticus TaxID=2479004 RepID=UPI000F8D09CA|nr:sterol desaturase family protein [Gynurincola endophyticus]
MKFEKIHNKGQARLFNNPYLEMLTKTHPLVIWGMYLPLIIYLPYYSHNTLGYPVKTVAIIFIASIFAWSLFEYFAHRFLFHWVTDSPKMKKIVYTMHGNHHHYPRDRQRLFMPPVPSIILAALIFGAQYLIMSNYAFMFFPGFILGYLMYGTMHYAIHAWNPPFKWMKPLWRNHHLHHYKDEDKGFGVSTTFWDRIFGTMFDLRKEKEDKKKVDELKFK